MLEIEYSVIVPVYNVEIVLERCIVSILGQTIQNFELILVDDGSTDQSGIICDQYQQKDARIKIIHQKNSGVSCARNSGLKIATGKYITFVDSDDYIDTTYLENLNASSADFVIGGFEIEQNETGESKKNKWERKKISIDETEEIIRLFKEAVFSFSCSKRYNKKIICDYNLQFDTELNLGEDSCFALSYLVHCENVEVIISCDYHYVRYNHETLSTAVMSIESIQNIEFLNNKVSDLLVPILGNKAENTMCMRMGIFYKSILGKILNNQEKCNYKFIKELYGQYWFGKVLERLDEVFFDESCKLKIVLKTKSALVFWIFLRMHNKRKSFLYTLKSKRN